MPLWDTVMITLVIGSTILFCFWAAFGPAEATAKIDFCAAKMRHAGSRRISLSCLSYYAKRNAG
jgi:hypothetical protein